MSVKGVCSSSWRSGSASAGTGADQRKTTPLFLPSPRRRAAQVRLRLLAVEALPRLCVELGPSRSSAIALARPVIDCKRPPLLPEDGAAVKSL